MSKSVASTLESTRWPARFRRMGKTAEYHPSSLAPSASRNAPVMLPAYVDFWCQTSPRPTPDPEVSLFIHGPQSGEPDVQVCWRADLVEDNQRMDWCDVVALLSPTTAECMSVPISRLRRWLIDIGDKADQGDLLGTQNQPAAAEDPRRVKDNQSKRVDDSRVGVLWRGDRDSIRINKVDDLQPGDTLVLPVIAEGWNELGHVPPQNPRDVAEQAYERARDLAVCRMHPTLRAQLPDSPAITELLVRMGDAEERLSQPDLRRLLTEAADSLGSDHADHANTFRNLANPRFGVIRESYPDNRGCVLKTRRRIGSATSWYCYLPRADEGEDDRSRTSRENPISLTVHTADVRNEVIRTMSRLPLDDLQETYRLAADLHDLGKADERFQAMLRRTDCTDAWLLTGMNSALLAKSDGMPQTPKQRKEARESRWHAGRVPP